MGVLPDLCPNEMDMLRVSSIRCGYHWFREAYVPFHVVGKERAMRCPSRCGVGVAETIYIDRAVTSADKSSRGLQRN